MKTFDEIFEELARHNDRSVIWNNWLDFLIKSNLIYHDGKNTDNYYDNEEEYVNLMKSWLNELNKDLETVEYKDSLGLLYEQVVLSQGKSKQLGQYYSPTCVAEITTELSLLNQNFHESKIVNDCACGSGRMLLASHVKSKGDLFCIGQDLDETSCKMCTLNFWSHGVRGSVLQMDSLTGKFYQGWRINKYLYHGISIPHIEEIHSIDEAVNFIELNKINKTIFNSNNEDEPVKTLVNGQTTLM